MDKLNRWQRAGIGLLGYGLPVFGMTYWMYGYIAESPEQVRNSIEACAAKLGSQAVKATALPKECQNYNYYFDSTTTTIDKDHKGETTETSKSTVYELKSRDDFLHDTQGIQGVKQESRFFIAEAAGGFAGLLGGLSLGLAAPTRRHEEEQ